MKYKNLNIKTMIFERNAQTSDKVYHIDTSRSFLSIVAEKGVFRLVSIF